MKSEIHTNKKKTISRKRGRKINVFYYVRNYKIENSNYPKLGIINFIKSKLLSQVNLLKYLKINNIFLLTCDNIQL